MVILLFAPSQNATVPAPKIKLVDFAHIGSLDVGRAATVNFTVKPQQMMVGEQAINKQL